MVYLPILRERDYMMDNELLLAAISEMMDKKFKEELQPIKDDISSLKSDVSSLKSDVSSLKDDMQNVKERLSNVEQSVSSLQLTLENETNRNIKLLAENHSNLIDKLNQAIKVSDKTTIYEIQVNILTNKVDKLEKEVAELKSKIA